MGLRHALELNDIKPLTGGDINEVYLLETINGSFVIKLNLARRFPGMFEAEAEGLKLLLEAKAFDIPAVSYTGIVDDYEYLIMDFIPSGSQGPRFWESFAQKLARLHQNSADQFGLDHSNYIGSLPQYNEFHDSAATFYISQRLEPQIELAMDKGFKFPDLNMFYKNITQLIPEEPAALVHGDLWNGNYLVSTMGEPVLIDPAVAFASREMDLGMMMLFGGFPNAVFEMYDELFPLPGDWKERIPIWQLYYLLVHLNLFGKGYLNRVTSILAAYS
ncbi:MAG: phosphotransferase [Flavobacteriaceae bacterium]|nr:phosphotransferase [Flavobacteriaceae bacterium]